MDITKDMRTLSGMKSMDEASKNIFLKKIGRWSLCRLNRDGMLCCQNMIICRRCIAHCRVGGHAGTEQETSQQSQRKEARVEIEKNAR